ncbi:uncharacterized WD repeat-containing protein C2A9.03-like [Andrographis paniculata]|uniref:uncharacterized WD repeat-containing protein C2A9.03-like n=1 Tax=Andrographis paniculata TaxID=175694 RepID=UPI0021E9ABD9|nr:uncharacterized WD repeat-containing protein C2A9.03-like [Andrographis paniculata]
MSIMAGDDEDEEGLYDFMDGEDFHGSTDDSNLDDYDLLMKVTDTSASQAREGKDIQGIPWDKLNITREAYRRMRLQQYKNYEDLMPLSGEVQPVDNEGSTLANNDEEYFDFFRNSRSVKPTILHFKLRNLVWATSKHDVYLISNNSVMHWSSSFQSLTRVINFSEHVDVDVAPSESHPGVSTIAVKDRFLLAGGFHGQLICKRLDEAGISFCTRATQRDENAITNAIEIFDNSSSSSGLCFVTCNNDCSVREYDLERFQLLNHFDFPWPVNHAMMSPNRKLLTVVGDDPNGLLIDARNGKTIASVSGHLDYSFTSAWHPEGMMFATGNQDKTCRVWDLRNLSASITILKGHIGAIRKICFSADGEFLVAAEPADFVHIYTVKGNYKQKQEIDFFGEITGVSLSPNDESMYVGIWDRTYASLLQYNRKHAYKYLDSVM